MIRYNFDVFLILILILLTSFGPDKHINKIIEGISASGIEVGMSLKKANSLLKIKCDIVKWGDYSYEYAYKNKGISLWVKMDDATKRIFSISVNPKIWKGTTKMGLVVSKLLTVKDVIAVYGRPKWDCTTDNTELSAEYPSKGIYFEVIPLPCCCQDEAVIKNFDSTYYNRSVTNIVIGEVGTNF